MAPSQSSDRTAQNQGMPADGRNSEAQAPHHTANTAGANVAVPRPPDPDAHTQDTHPHYHPSSTALYQLNRGVLPTAVPEQSHGHGFNNLSPWRNQYQQNALPGSVQSPQLQTARMHRMLWAPSPVLFGTLGRQQFHGTYQSPYGAVRSPYVHGTPQVSYPDEQVRESLQVSHQGQQVYGNFQAYQSRPPDVRPYRQPSVNLLDSSHGQLNYQPPPAQVSPPIQEWPTWNLNVLARRKHEQRSRELQEQAQQAADKHLTEAVLQQRGDTKPAFSSAPSTSGKRKATVGDSQPLPTLPPFLRPRTQSRHTGSAYRPGDGQQYHSQYPHRSIYEYYPISQPPQQSPLYTSHLPSHRSIRNEYEQNNPQTSSANYEHEAGMNDSLYHENASEPLSSNVSPPPQHTGTQSPAEPLPAKSVLREDIPQPISRRYKDYKWPVKLYELRPGTKFDFAHAYMEDWFEKNVLSTNRYKWHCHTTEGFIEQGNRFSILVLHNAADPFTWNTPSESTTSFAVYGRFAHKHEELRWTTVTPWIPGLIGLCADFVFKNRWDFDMTLATERRFHRAYWLAANMMPLKNMLKQRVIHEKPHDEPEQAETEEAITFTAEDLQYQWFDGPMSAEHSKRVWQKIHDEVDRKDVHTLGSEHMTIGCKEREWETERYG